MAVALVLAQVVVLVQACRAWANWVRWELVRELDLLVALALVLRQGLALVVRAGLAVRRWRRWAVRAVGRQVVQVDLVAHLAVHVVVRAYLVLGAVVAWVVSVVLVLALVLLQDRWEDSVLGLVRAWALALSARAAIRSSVEDRQATVQARVERLPAGRACMELVSAGQARTAASGERCKQ